MSNEGGINQHLDDAPYGKMLRKHLHSGRQLLISSHGTCVGNMVYRAGKATTSQLAAGLCALACACNAGQLDGFVPDELWRTSAP